MKTVTIPMRFPIHLLLAALSAICLPSLAQADVMHDAAWVECDPAGDKLSVRYGKISSAERDPAATVFWSLVRYTRRPDGDPDHVSERLRAETRCRLTTGDYVVSLEPVPMNVNLQATCGAVIRGSIAITREGRQLLAPMEFETGDCAGPTKVVRAIMVDGKRGTLAFEREDQP